ncbi:Zn-ribbon domain-containing OB-fold protein [Bordetella sp. BOR01]|uniref:Zn-ribbon domain-containing OB-fold protein n=1 Tax=Bordetella sp. BOR01 TaxID=2854779 RepID=UPI001C439BA5|nr:OB-fold domain-containing protein [Bordetella sp. BOR01]MBV7484569.1 OB-fold domain-containing protein [Bordetella sp. BOR01]
MSTTCSETDPAQGDWTTGQPLIRYQHCSHCQATWYFKRGFCPQCGAADPHDRIACGTGQVYAVTQVNRPPVRELAAHTPYCIVLVDAAEGFRLMAHGDLSLRIGDRVTAQYKPFGAQFIPHFTLEPA